MRVKITGTAFSKNTPLEQLEHIEEREHVERLRNLSSMLTNTPNNAKAIWEVLSEIK